MDQTDQDKNSEEIKELLEEDIELNKENNELLKGMHRSARWSLIFTIVKWVIIIGSVFGLYYYFGQFLSSSLDRINKIVGTTTTTTSATGSSTIQIKIEQLKNAIKSI